MKRLEFDRAHDAGQLLGELSALPDLQPTVEPDGERTARFAFKTLGERIVVEIPDEADEQAVQAVVEAHRPAPKADERHQRAADLAHLRNQAQRDVTWAALLRTLDLDNGARQ